MAKKLRLGLDQGTTGTTAILFDEEWRMAGRGYQEITQYYPKDGWVEHDPIEILNSVQIAVHQALEAAKARPEDIDCMGVDHEGESVVVWDADTGQPVYPAIVWQDRRTTAYVDQIKPQYTAMIQERTGLPLDPYFSATKLKWILDFVDPQRRQLRSGRLLMGTMDVWITWNLTRGGCYATDASTASRTMLYNIHTGRWDPDILTLMELEEDALPQIKDSAALYGCTDPESFFGIRCPIYSVIVDQQAALFGQACIKPGMLKTTYGTGSFMLMNTGNVPALSSNGLLTTVAWQLNGHRFYALDGGNYIAGAATQWLRDGLRIISNASQTEQMAIQAGGNGGVYFVPAFTGLAAPYWDSHARGMLIGITGGTTREHIVRAALEAIAFQVKDVLDVMCRETNISIPVLRCDGGAVCNQFLMQFQADILNLPLEIPEIQDTTALGAAYMAALGSQGFSSPEDMTIHWKASRRYEPRMSADEREQLLYNWHCAVKRSLHWTKNR